MTPQEIIDFIAINLGIEAGLISHDPAFSKYFFHAPLFDPSSSEPHGAWPKLDVTLWLCGSEITPVVVTRALCRAMRANGVDLGINESNKFWRGKIMSTFGLKDDAS